MYKLSVLGEEPKSRQRYQFKETIPQLSVIEGYRPQTRLLPVKKVSNLFEAKFF